jgi:sec-independent protein translocase protein TatA
MYQLAFLNSLGTWDMVIILVLGLLLFGKRLPDVGRSLGKGIVEFKKGLKGVEDEIDTQSTKSGDGYREQLPPYRAPTNAQGEDARVSRSDTAEPGIDPTKSEKSTVDR